MSKEQARALQAAYEAARRVHREGWLRDNEVWCADRGVDPVTGKWLWEVQAE